ncbi:MAG: hypothetical protein PHV34_21775 [Verrucomicrobiae bacterium]|nr:hypothetical protein [Verrucomicrobiae bacterium]
MKIPSLRFHGINTGFPIALISLLVAVAPPLGAAEPELKMFQRQLNAQSGMTLIPWYKGNKGYTVHFKGVVDNPANPGKKLYKLDISFNQATRVYWGIPVNLPVEGNLKTKTTYAIMNEKGGKGKCGIGFGLEPCPNFRDNYIYTHIRTEEKTALSSEKWETVEMNDIRKYCVETAAPTVARKYLADAAPENISFRLQSITFFLSGTTGTRMTLLVDELNLEGATFDDSETKDLVARRWQPAGEKLKRRINALKQRLENAIHALENESLETREANAVRNQALEKAGQIDQTLKNLAKRASVEQVEEKELSREIRAVEAIRLKEIDHFLSNTKEHFYLPFVVDPLNGQKILPTDLSIVGKIGLDLHLTASPGEYEPASFVIRALADLKGLTVSTSDLVCKESGGKISGTHVDIRTVKCWYQAGTAWVSINQQRDKKVLVPELLLKDDSLVAVDAIKQENYLKLTFPDWVEYRWISDPKEKTEPGPYRIWTASEFPVQDAPNLQPLDLPAGTNKQFWITLQAPADAKPGDYEGTITLSQKDSPIGTFKLNVKILPFKLADPCYTSSVYYRGILSHKHPGGTISSEDKSATQLLEEFKNLAAHGITNPLCYQPFKDKELLDQYFEIRKKAGINATELYYCYGIDIEDTDIPRLKQQVTSVREYLGKNDIRDVYFYGADEAMGDRLKAQRTRWNAVHEAGGKIIASGIVRENFEKMGDIQDLLVCENAPDKAEAARWHRNHHKIWCYGYPQAGVENPAVYRHNYGLLLWQKDYDGAATFAYHISFGNIWNDFDYNHREENFTYPTINGVIDTMAWEGYREGVDDVRYLTTLLREIETAKANGSAKQKNAAANAEKYLLKLKGTNLEEENLDEIRAEMVKLILSLKKSDTY